MSKVTVYVDKDEWYPVWDARQATAADRIPDGDPVEVDAETAQRWARVFREFDQVQSEIAALAKGAE